MDDEQEIILSGIDFDNHSDIVEFEISERPRGERFEIVGSSSITDGHKYGLSVTANHKGKSYSLETQPVEFILDEWLNNLGDVWCPIYRQWQVVRPKDKLRQVLKGMIVAVSELHMKNRSHGNLSKLENYALRFVSSDKGAVEHDYCKVTLLGGSNQGTLADDRKELNTLIFDNILGANSSLAWDWTNLQSKMKVIPLEQCHGPKCLFEIASHSALLHWKAKRKAYIRYWDFIVRDKSKKFKTGMHLSVGRTWQQIIPQPSPFHKVLTSPHVVYSNKPEQVVKYLRYLFLHIDDRDSRRIPVNYNRLTQPEFEDEQYVEMEVARMFPKVLQEVLNYTITVLHEV